MRYNLIPAIVPPLAIVSLILGVFLVAPPVAHADDDAEACLRACQRQRDTCEYFADRAYRRCQRYGEEAQGYAVYQRQLQVCEMEYYNCVELCD